MSKKPESAYPESASPQRVRLLVRTVSAMGDQRHYRAGLGPFVRDPVEVEAWPEQVAAIKADPMLAVAEVGAGGAE